jgi:nitric oxide dioxygenase
VSITPSDRAQCLLSAESEVVVKATATVVAEHAEEITACFYPRMFAAHPNSCGCSTRATSHRRAEPSARGLGRGPCGAADRSRRPAFSPRDAADRAQAHLARDPPGAVHDCRSPPAGRGRGGARRGRHPEIANAWDEVHWLFAMQLVAQEARLYLQAGVDPAPPVRPYRVVRRIEQTDNVVSQVLEPADGGKLPQIAPGR